MRRSIQTEGRSRISDDERVKHRRSSIELVKVSHRLPLNRNKPPHQYAQRRKLPVLNSPKSPALASLHGSTGSPSLEAFGYEPIHSSASFAARLMPHARSDSSPRERRQKTTGLPPIHLMSWSPLSRRSECGDLPLSLISWSSISLEVLVGAGSFGEVWRGTWNMQPVAVKIMRLHNKDVFFVKRFAREVKTLQYLRHPGIVSFYGVCLDPPAIITELCSGGTLYNRLHSDPRPDTATFYRENIIFARQLANAMAYLHSQGILHLDLSSHNILLNDGSHIKITDFGLARTVEAQSDLVTSGSLCHPRWRPPELARGEPPSFACDVYSYGLVLWELLTGQLPYPNRVADIAAARAACSGERPVIPDSIPLTWAKILCECWAADPALRPSFDTLCARLDVL